MNNNILFPSSLLFAFSTLLMACGGAASGGSEDHGSLGGASSGGTGSGRSATGGAASGGTGSGGAATGGAGTGGTGAKWSGLDAKTYDDLCAAIDERYNLALSSPETVLATAQMGIGNPESLPSSDAEAAASCTLASAVFSASGSLDISQYYGACQGTCDAPVADTAKCADAYVSWLEGLTPVVDSCDKLTVDLSVEAYTAGMVSALSVTSACAGLPDGCFASP